MINLQGGESGKLQFMFFLLFMSNVNLNEKVFRPSWSCCGNKSIQGFGRIQNCTICTISLKCGSFHCGCYDLNIYKYLIDSSYAFVTGRGPMKNTDNVNKGIVILTLIPLWSVNNVMF